MESNEPLRTQTPVGGTLGIGRRHSIGPDHKNGDSAPRAIGGEKIDLAARVLRARLLGDNARTAATDVAELEVARREHGRNRLAADRCNHTNGCFWSE